MSNTFDESPARASGTFRIGDAFSRTFGIYTRHFPAFIALAVFAHIPRFISIYLMPQPAFLPGQQDPWAFWRWFMVSNVVTTVCASLTSGMLTYGVVQDLRGQSFSTQDCFHQAIPRLLPLLGIAICVGFVTFFATLALIIPGFIVAAIYYVAQPVCVVEARGVFDSMSRSAGLTKGFRGQIFGIFLIVMIAAFALGAAQALVFGPFGQPARSIFSVATQILVGSFGATLVGVVYYLLRVAKDGVDIEKIASVFE